MAPKSYASVKAKGYTWNLHKFKSQIGNKSLEEGVEIAFEPIQKSKKWKIPLPYSTWSGLLWVPNPPLQFSPHGVTIVKNEQVNYGEYSYRTNNGSEPAQIQFERLLKGIQTPGEIEGQYEGRRITYSSLLDLEKPPEFFMVGSFQGPLEYVIAAAKETRKGEIGALHVVEERLETYLK